MKPGMRGGACCAPGSQQALSGDQGLPAQGPHSRGRYAQAVIADPAVQQDPPDLGADTDEPFCTCFHICQGRPGRDGHVHFTGEKTWSPGHD